MSDQQNNQQKVKHDPDVVMAKITQFIGFDPTAKPKLSRDMFDDVVEAFHKEQEEALKMEVMATLKDVVADRKKLVEAEKAFNKARAEAGNALNDKLQKLYQKIEKVQQDKEDTRAIVAGTRDQLDRDMQSDTSTQNIPNTPPDNGDGSNT